jgi:hypothetical protein
MHSAPIIRFFESPSGFPKAHPLFRMSFTDLGDDPRSDQRREPEPRLGHEPRSDGPYKPSVTVVWATGPPTTSGQLDG